MATRMYKRFAQNFLVAFLCVFTLSSCALLQANTDKLNVFGQKTHLYLVLNPINEAARESTVDFLKNAKQNLRGNSKIIAPGQTLTVAIFCQDSNPEILGASYLENQASIRELMGGVNKILKQVEGKKCDATANSLIRISSNISDSVKHNAHQGKIFVVIKLPWNNSEIIEDATLINRLKQNFEEIEKSGNVGKITFLCADGQNTDKIAQIFGFLGNRLVVRSDLQTIEELKSINKMLNI